MPKPQKPTAAYMANGWYLQIAGLKSPHFETLSGLSKETGSVTIVDAGTNIAYKFNSQILNFGAISLSRTMDGSVDDNEMDLMVNLSQVSGQKFAGMLIKLHFNTPVFSIGFEGLNFTKDEWPEFGIESTEKLLKRYEATVDTWIKIV